MNVNNKIFIFVGARKSKLTKHLKKKTQQNTTKQNMKKK